MRTPEDGGPPIPFRFTTLDALIADGLAMLAQRRSAADVATFLRAGYVAVAVQDAAAVAAADLAAERAAAREAALQRLQLARDAARRVPVATRVSRRAGWAYAASRGGRLATLSDRLYP